MSVRFGLGARSNGSYTLHRLFLKFMGHSALEYLRGQIPAMLTTQGTLGRDPR
jgi:hypothetical protein